MRLYNPDNGLGQEDRLLPLGLHPPAGGLLLVDGHLAMSRVCSSLGGTGHCLTESHCSSMGAQGSVFRKSQAQLRSSGAPRGTLAPRKDRVSSLKHEWKPLQTEHSQALRAVSWHLPTFLFASIWE